MENCVIYSHRPDFDVVVRLVQQGLPKAEIAQHADGPGKSIVATIKGGFLSKTKTLTINYRQRKNPSYTLTDIECPLTQNLSGMVNFIQSLPAKNGTVPGKFLHKVMAANAEMGFMADPEITPEFEKVLRSIATELDAFLFSPPNHIFNKSAGQYFSDKNFNKIIDMQGDSDIDDISVEVDTKYYDAPEDTLQQDQRGRKNRSEAFLNAQGVKVNINLPCVESETNVRIREVNEIIDRIYALLVIAARGEGVEQVHLDRIIHDRAIHSFSPEESAVLNSQTLTDQQRAYATWRYESLSVLLWSIGKMDTLKYPSEIADVPAMVGMMLNTPREDFTRMASVRDRKIILDELDKTYRMHWACVDARLKGQPVAGGIEPGVVYERHYALNWLTNYGEDSWDDVQTHT